ncbi:hypothetical protein, partial [Geobacillus thermodenitrificans]
MLHVYSMECDTVVKEMVGAEVIFSAISVAKLTICAISCGPESKKPPTVSSQKATVSYRSE